MTGVLLVTLIAPIICYHAIAKARKSEFNSHKKIQTGVYILCVSSVVVLEILIRASGGSGSISSESSHAHKRIYKTMMIIHIIGAVVTYILWTYLIIKSNRTFQKTLPGQFSISHKKIGIAVFIGLIYTGVTASIVYLMTLNLV